MTQNIDLNKAHVFSNYFPDKISREIGLKLAEKLEEGSICIDLDEYKYPDLEISKIKKSEFLAIPNEGKVFPFILLDEKLLYLHRYFFYESQIINRIFELINQGECLWKDIYQKCISVKQSIFSIIGEKSSNWQILAALSPLINQLTLITGGPGTGKTTSVSKFIHIFLSLFPDKSVIMTAPTGKASVRMKESLQKYAENIEDEGLRIKFQKIRSMTLHSLLGISKYDTSYTTNHEKKLSYDVVIVDESSMIDISLMFKLFYSIRPETKLILLGDKFQLSSIGAGSIFGDLCFSVPMNKFSEQDIEFYNAINENNIINAEEDREMMSLNPLSGKVIELKKSYRFSEDKGIGKISKLILEGDIEGILKFYNADKAGSDVIFTENLDNDLTETFLNLYNDYAAEDDITEAFSKLNKIRILCSVTSGKLSTGYFNGLIETRLFDKGLLKPDIYYYDKQPIMIMENDKNLGIFNGDIGIVRLDRESGRYFAYFLTPELKKISCNQIRKYSTAYAMSIHKSQGSEFENVIVVLNDAGKDNFLTRELVYTALTRAKNRVLLISEKEMLINSVKNKVNRISGINYRLNNSGSII